MKLNVAKEERHQLVPGMAQANPTPVQIGDAPGYSVPVPLSFQLIHLNPD